MSNETTPTPTDGQVEPVAYPVIVDEKTLFALIQSAEAIIRNPRPDRVEAFAEAKVTIFAQMRNTDAENAALREEVSAMLNLIPNDLRVRVQEHGEERNDAASLAVSIGRQTGTIERLREEKEACEAALVEAKRRLSTLRATNAGLVADKERLEGVLKEAARELENASCQARTAEDANHYEGYARQCREALPCDRPPDGWKCTRGYGHLGSCAAIKTRNEQN